MSVMIDADKAIELLKALLKALHRDDSDFASIRYNIGVGAAINEIRHLKEEAEQEDEV